MNVLFLIKQPFPYGSAYSTRARAITDALLSLGHSVLVVCSAGGDAAGDRAYLDARPNVSRVVVSEGRGILQSVAEAKEYGAKVAELLASDAYDIVISSSMHDKIALVLRAARSLGVPVVLESCEWYHHSSWTLGRFDPRYWAFSYAWRNHFPKADGYIAISRLLEKHYRETGKPVARIPTITDVLSVTPRLDSPLQGGRISLLFAGRFGGTKDDVLPFARAIASDEELLIHCRLVIVGPSRDEVFSHEDEVGSFARLESAGALRVTGRLPQRQVEVEYRAADFGCFARPKRRSSDAGFSTKLGEGMAVGTPFIVNDTGDITDYVEDGVSGFVLRDMGPVGIQSVLRDVLRASDEERAAMRAAARSVAERCFDWRSYTGAISQLLSEVMEAHCD